MRKYALKIGVAQPRGLQVLAIEVAAESDVEWAVGQALAIMPAIVVIVAQTRLPDDPLDRPGWERLFADIRRRIVLRCQVVPDENVEVRVH